MAYSNLVFVRDTKDTAYLGLKLSKAYYDSVGILTSVEELLKHRFHLVLGSSTEIGTGKDGLLSFLHRSEDVVKIHLIEPIVKSLAVSIVEIGLGDFAVVASGASGTGSTNLARCGCTSLGVA